MKHIPVLLKEVLGAMNLSKGKFIIDGTIDGGGHAREILRLIMPKSLFLGVDLDSDLIKEQKEVAK
jgi:Predicted S-adenosylmethionine-dependent methyltransferase involved in cell envelope biogenesis